MNLAAAIRAAAPGSPDIAAESLAALDPPPLALGTVQRAAHLIGQCAHESAGFTRTVEVMWYSAERLMAVWPSRFRSEQKAEEYAGDPEKLANEVYGGRMGNTEPGDGWRYRGRGWLQLTGRNNYRVFGKRIGVDLEAEPKRAAEPEIAWRIAAVYLASRRRLGRTALEWADADNVELVTRIVNGGVHGLEDRRQRTAAALTSLRGMRPVLRLGDKGPDVLMAQRMLALAGARPGPLDGWFGQGTLAAVTAFQQAHGLTADGIVGGRTWAGLAAAQRAAGG